ncbi:MAG: thermonuclease family protein [Luteolibacter sp.]
MKTCRLLLVFALAVLTPSLSAKEWITYEECSLVDDSYFDGDSFNIRAQTGYTYIFRLYGVDCGETDVRYPDRLVEQGKEFGIEPDEVVKWGREAQKFVKKFLRKPFTVHTQKEKAGGQSKKNRYYAVVVNSDGERLDEALVSAGLARAFGVGAEWPEGTAPERYIRKLHALESRAKRGDVGVWKDSTK